MTDCQHENVTWDPVDISYNGDGTASIEQSGVCTNCNSDVYQLYESTGVKLHYE